MADKTQFTGSFILAPTPVALIGCSHEELGRNVLTVAWCGVACSDPPTVSVSIRPERHSYRMIQESRCFTVNIPTVDLLRAVDICGTLSGRDGDKFEAASLTAAPSTSIEAPLVAECPINLECTVKNIFPAGVHHVFWGEVVARHADPFVLTDGRLDFSKIPLISYVQGQYWSLGRPVGTHGFSRKSD